MKLNNVPYFNWNRATSTVLSLKEAIVNRIYSAYCFVLPQNPVTKKHEFHLIPTFVEKTLGECLYPFLLYRGGGVVTEENPSFGEYATLVREVGEELAQQSPRPGLHFEFKVVNNKADNAWCLPGGKIAINLGLIQNIEKEANQYGLQSPFALREKIAAVLSHEITHATARHSSRAMELQLFIAGAVMAVQYALTCLIKGRYDRQIEKAQEQKDNHLATTLASRRDAMVLSQSLFFNKITSWIVSGIGLCKSRTHEFEADKYGIHLMHAAGMNAESAVWLQSYFAAYHPQNTGIRWFDRALHLFSTHPSSEERLAVNIKTLKDLPQ